jgi:alpha-amylase
MCTGGTPFYVHEVIDQGGEPIKVQEYFGVGRVTEFRYGIKVRALICKPFKGTRNRFPA